MSLNGAVYRIYTYYGKTVDPRDVMIRGSKDQLASHDHKQTYLLCVLVYDAKNRRMAMLSGLIREVFHKNNTDK